MSWRIRHLPHLLAVSAGLLVVAAVVGAVTAGGAGGLGAAAGVALVTAGYVFSTLVLAWVDRVHTPLVLPVGLAVYVVKLLAVGAALAVAFGAGWAGRVPMAYGLVAAVAVWTGAHIRWVMRHPPSLAYQPPASTDDAPIAGPAGPAADTPSR